MVKIATIALKGSYDIDHNVREHIRYIDEAAAEGAGLVVFPEISLQGYPRDFAHFYPQRLRDAFDCAESVEDGVHAKAIADHARQRGMHVVYGMHEKSDVAGVIYNTAVLTGPDGFIGKYRKVHVAITEQLTWRRGKDWPVFDTSLGRIGMLICYDKMWPESTRELMLRGADIMVMPTAWFIAPDEPGPVETNVMVEQYQLFDRARAAENCRWFVSSNFAGDFGGGRFIGLSQIVDPKGRILASTGLLEPGMAIADVDIAAGIADAHSFQGARLVRDRRADTYDAATGRIPLAVDG